MRNFIPRKVLLSHNLNLPRSQKYELAQFFFESLDFANFQFGMNAANIMLYHGLVSGLVMDIGESHTSVTPIAESYVLE